MVTRNETCEGCRWFRLLENDVNKGECLVNSPTGYGMVYTIKSNSCRSWNTPTEAEMHVNKMNKLATIIGVLDDICNIINKSR